MPVIITITNEPTTIDSSDKVYNYSEYDRILKNVCKTEYEVFYSGQNKGRIDYQLIDAIQNKTDNFDKQYMDKYVHDMTDYYDSLIKEINKSEHSDKIKKVQSRNIEKELNKFLKHPDLCYQDIYKKHPNYCFTNKDPMSGDTIKQIRKDIAKTMGVVISYEHPIFQMLKRGIGLYIECMPCEYKRILQQLLSNKELGIVISARDLCLGIDLPIRSTCLYGHPDTEFTLEDYLQMSGRAGRRGHDNQGNILFYNQDYNYLMKGTLPELKGSEHPIYDHYEVIYEINKNLKPGVFDNIINPERQIIKTNKLSNQQNISKNINNLKWFLRDYKNYDIFIKKINNIEKELWLMVSKFDKQIHLLSIICDLLDVNCIDEYKSNKYHSGYDTIIQIVIMLYNTLSTEKYKISKEILMEIFKNMKRLIIKKCDFY